MRLFLYLLIVGFTLSANEGIERWKVEPQVDLFENLIGRKIENTNLKNINGKASTLYKENAKGTIVCIFDVDCPLSLKLAPKLKRLEGLRFGLV